MNHIHACTRKLYDIFKVQDALVQCVDCIRQYAVTIHSLVDSVIKT
jgi:hypothetical protein